LILQTVAISGSQPMFIRGSRCRRHTPAGSPRIPFFVRTKPGPCKLHFGGSENLLWQIRN